jgi:integrase
MPKQNVPAWTLHKPTGQARVRIDGKVHYCGKFGTPAANAEYRRLMATWLQTHDLPQPERDQFTVGKLAAAYMEFAKGYYRKAGRPTSQVHIVRNALRRLVRSYRKLPVADLGPKRLKALRVKLIDEGSSRVYINAMIGVIKAMVRWGLEEELIDGSKRNRALLAKGVCWLRQGRTAARESEPVRPVPQARIDALHPHVSPEVWGLIRFQLATGARPGEAVLLRMRDVNTSGEVWEYRPADHKTSHHGKERVVMIGPAGQAVLREFIRTDTEAYEAVSKPGGRGSCRAGSK